MELTEFTFEYISNKNYTYYLKTKTCIHPPIPHAPTHDKATKIDCIQVNPFRYRRLIQISFISLSNHRMDDDHVVESTLGSGSINLYGG